jgi:hypothetical protein
MHHKPYSLKWIRNNHKLHITKQCTLKFAISSKFVDEVTFDVVPLNECVMVLGSPYLYDRKEIFYREQNQYHLIKEGNGYGIHAPSLKFKSISSNNGTIMKDGSCKQHTFNCAKSRS